MKLSLLKRLMQNARKAKTTREAEKQLRQDLKRIWRDHEASSLMMNDK